MIEKSSGLIRLCFIVLIGTIAILSVVAQPTNSNSTTVPSNTTGNVIVTTTHPQNNTTPIPISVRVGRQFTINLESNRTTGYEWQLTKPLDTKIVKIISSTYNEPQNGLVGQGSTETWTFQAVGKGTTTIAMKYVRPWEKDAAPARTQNFTLTVQ